MTGPPRLRAACHVDSLDSSDGRTSHPAALCGAATASFGASLTVLILEPGAFDCTGIADVGTKPAQLVCVAATPGHPLSSDDADIGTVPEQLNAPGACVRVRFLQAGGSAVFTLNGTLCAGSDAGLMLLVHTSHPLS